MTVHHHVIDFNRLLLFSLLWRDGSLINQTDNHGKKNTKIHDSIRYGFKILNKQLARIGPRALLHAPPPSFRKVER